MAFTRINCNTTMSTSPKELDTGKPCVICQDTSRNVTLPEQLRTGKNDVYQQPIAGLTLLALCCTIGAAPRVNVDFPSRCGAQFPSVSHPMTTAGKVLTMLGLDKYEYMAAPMLSLDEYEYMAASITTNNKSDHQKNLKSCTEAAFSRAQAHFVPDSEKNWNR